MSNRRIALLALFLAFPAPGCCTLARLFCGPDDSEWVQISYRTPREAVATFKEAVRRDNSQVIYDSLGEGFKRGNNLALLEAHLAWEWLKEEYTGLHLLGYAEVTELESTGSRAAFELEYSGYRFRVDLVRQEYWAIRTILENLLEISEFEAFEVFVQRRPVGNGEVLVLVFPDPEDYARKNFLIEDLDLEPDHIVELGFFREWKVDGFEPIEDTG